jgi:hypothetical protein
MKAATIIISLSGILVCQNLTGQEQRRPAGAGLMERFKQLDRNGDGKLTRDEVPSSLPFDEWDTNKDGVVTLDEVKAYYTKPRAGAQPAAQPAPATPGALFRRVEIPGFTNIAEGNNGIALADLNHDGLVDIVATYTEPNRGLSNTGHHLRVLINHGDFRFQVHPITIRQSKLTCENFGPYPEIPNLVDFNGDRLLDIFITRSSPFLAGKPWPGIEPIGNTLLLSDGAWDTFRDVSAKLGARNETAYNRQSSIADVNKDGWLDIAIGCDNIGNAMGGVPHSRLYVSKDEGGRMKDESDRAVSRSPDRDTGSTVGLPGARPGDLTVGASAGSGDPRRAFEKFEDGRFEDIGGSDRVPDFGGFYHDSAKDKAGPGITLRDLDNDGDLDLVQSFHCDVRQPLLPYSPGEYRQGVFCWKNLLAETAAGNGTGSDQDDRCLSQFPAGLRFEKVSGNGLACEARLKYNRDKQLYEPVGQAPGLPYLFFADVDNDGLQDVLAIGPSDPGWAPRAEDVGGRFWHNLGHFQFQEATSAAGLDALNWTYRQWYTAITATRAAARSKPISAWVSERPGTSP